MTFPRNLPAPPRLALVGDRSADVQAHSRIPVVIDFLNASAGDPIEVYWLHSTTIAAPEDVSGFDGVWVVPGSPYASTTGVLCAIGEARRTGIPFLGTCGGFQHMLLEFARNACGLSEVVHGEVEPGAPDQLIVPLDCSLLGEEATVFVSGGTLAAEILGTGPATERYFCRYGLNPGYLGTLESEGLVFSGKDENGDPRVAELPGHPFFVGSLFQPELSSGPGWAHPLIAAFASAVRRHALGREASVAGVGGSRP